MTASFIMESIFSFVGGEPEQIPSILGTYCRGAVCKKGDKILTGKFIFIVSASFKCRETAEIQKVAESKVNNRKISITTTISSREFNSYKTCCGYV